MKRPIEEHISNGGLMSIAEYEEFMERQHERLKDKKSFVSLDEV
jgi:hypothetical protein